MGRRTLITAPTWQRKIDPQQAHPGIVVIDVSDPTNPQPTAYLDETPAGLNPHENNKVNEARGLLGLAQSNGPNFAVYDLNDDCAHPKLASTFNVPNSSGHMGGWAEDGKTYYIGQSFRGVSGILPIIDVTDPYNAKWLLNWTFTGDGRPHDLSTNEDGTRMYSGQPGNFGVAPNQFFVRAGRAGDPGHERHSVPSPQSADPDRQQALLE